MAARTRLAASSTALEAQLIAIEALLTLIKDVDGVKKITDPVTVTGSITVTGIANFIPIAKAAIFNTALPVAEANWLAVGIVPTNSPSYLRIYVCVAIAGIVRFVRTVGGVTVTEDLNDGVALVANAAYMFTVEWRTADTCNIRYSTTGGNILTLRIDEIGAGE